ncbi:MAG: lipid-binding SYLF domain-containing protein [Planctomycetota bacterium]|jgi:lipid-binding SYLF domain-containing protein
MNIKILVLLVMVAAIMVTGCASPEGTTASEQRSYVIQMREDTVAELYEEKPLTREKIAKSAGYGVFSNININLLLLSSGNGFGIVRDMSTGKDTYMKMRMIGAGFGAGVKDFRAVIIFKTPQALSAFTEEGWEWGGHADAAAKSGDSGVEKGLADEVTGDMEIYNFTEAGIALQATIAGTKYWKDDDLN